jgi:large subunit ribosomal protein L17
MRHKNLGRKFNRRPNQRKALLAGLVTQLIRHEQIITTLPKAKDLKRLIDKYITTAKKGDLNSRRICIGRLREEDMVKKLFEVIAPRYASRNGGYSRVVKIGHRYGDAAPMAVIELVDRDEEAKGKADRERRAQEEAEGERAAA